MNRMFATLLLTLTLAACRKGEQATKADTSTTAPRPPVQTAFARPETRELPMFVELSGTLAADEQSEVATQAPGVVAEVMVELGQRVKKGQPLVRIDTREASLRAAQAGANVDQARLRLGIDSKGSFDPEAVPEVKVAREAAELAEQDAKRTKELYESHTVPQAVWDSARTRAEQARAQYVAAVAGARSSHAAMRAASAQAGIAGKQVADGVIRSPFDGAIAERRISPGEFANVGRAMVVVVSDDPLRLKLDVPEEDIAKVTQGKSVDVEVAAYPGQLFKGTVARVGASLRAQSRTLPIEATVPNPDGKLKAGLFARARVAVEGKLRKVLLVPDGALSSTGSSMRVFVKRGGKVEEKLVKTGVHLPGLTEVSGIEATDEIAIKRIDELSDGADVATGG